jgi:hypothetical protein
MNENIINRTAYKKEGPPHSFLDILNLVLPTIDKSKIKNITDLEIDKGMESKFIFTLITSVIKHGLERDTKFLKFIKPYIVKISEDQSLFTEFIKNIPEYHAGNRLLALNFMLSENIKLRQMVERILIDLYKGQVGIRSELQILWEVDLNPKNTLMKVQLKVVMDFLVNCDIPMDTIDEMMKRWVEGLNGYPLKFYYEIYRINTIESRFKGCAQILNQFYGINEFARFTPDILEEMYLDHNNLDKKYYLIIQASADYNNAFDDTNINAEIYKNMKGRGYGIKVIEVSSSLDMVQKLAKLKTRFKSKIPMIILKAHGSPNSITLGNEGQVSKEISSSPKINKKNLLEHNSFFSRIKNRLAKENKDYFTNNPLIIFNSCSTGAKGGIAQELQKLGNFRIIAPPVDVCSEKHIFELSENGEIKAEVTYHDSKAKEDITIRA